MNTVTMLGRLIITGEIEAKTGLHIGGSAGALAIGNVDLPVIRNARTNQPYIPGSSLKGKMRSLSEKLTAAPQNKPVGQIRMHVAESQDEYQQYWVNPVFGVPGDIKFEIAAPTRLVVRDVDLSDVSAKELLDARTDQPYTEVKWEVAIDRVTSVATPRQIERVPAGAIFGPMELVFSVFAQSDVALFGNVLTAMQLVEDDYLGGQGSRGSGKIAFRNLTIAARKGTDYAAVPVDVRFKEKSLDDLLKAKPDLLTWAKGLFSA